MDTACDYRNGLLRYHGRSDGHVTPTETGWFSPDKTSKSDVGRLVHVEQMKMNWNTVAYSGAPGDDSSSNMGNDIIAFTGLLLDLEIRPVRCIWVKVIYGYPSYTHVLVCVCVWLCVNIVRSALFPCETHTHHMLTYTVHCLSLQKLD